MCFCSYQLIILSIAAVRKTPCFLPRERKWFQFPRAFRICFLLFSPIGSHDSACDLLVWRLSGNSCCFQPGKRFAHFRSLSLIDLSSANYRRILISIGTIDIFPRSSMTWALINFRLRWKMCVLDVRNLQGMRTSAIRGLFYGTYVRSDAIYLARMSIILISHIIFTYYTYYTR